MIDIQLQWLPHGQGLPVPTYATNGAAGLDVVAAEDVTLAPGQRHAVATGFAVAIPEGFEVQVRPRSGLALKHGITCLNTPGTIDHDYRGEVKVMAGRYGPYVSDGATHATLPKGAEPTAITLDEAVRLIDEKAAKGPSKKGGRKSGRRKSA